MNNIAHFSLGNYVARIFSTLPTYLMPLIIIAVLTTEASAYFYIPLSISGILAMVAGSVSFSLLAEGSYEPAMLRSQVIKAIKFMPLLLIPGIIILFLFGKPMLSLFGADYAQNSLHLLWLFGLSWLPASLNALYVTIIRVQKRIKPLIYISALVSISTIVLSYLLMNWIGLIGVGIAWLSAQTIVALVVGPLMLRMAGISLSELLKPRRAR